MAEQNHTSLRHPYRQLMLGVLSLALCFALRDTVSNTISGFLFSVDPPFTVYDLVEMNDQYGRYDLREYACKELTAAGARPPRQTIQFTLHTVQEQAEEWRKANASA